jgi:hypothetical protein
MNEKEIRERIDRFLRKTARNLVVPASVSLGLLLSGCDLPKVAPPYLMYLPSPDAALDVASMEATPIEATPMDATPMDVGAELAGKGTP